jgi:hypothetical protein
VQAAERDDVRITAWREERWPVVKGDPRAHGTPLIRHDSQAAAGGRTLKSATAMPSAGHIKIAKYQG